MIDPMTPPLPAGPPPAPMGLPSAMTAMPDDGPMADAPEVNPEVPSFTPRKNLEGRVFEDYFPPLDLTEKEETDLCAWFARDLKACVRHINKEHVDRWATYRLMYMLDYVEKFYPSMSMGLDFASGILCDKVLDGMNRMKKAVFGPRPFFMVDDRVSHLEDIGLIHRLEWYLQTVFEADLDIRRAVGNQGLFDYLIDGSMIMEADQIYEKIPMRVIETYLPGDLPRLLADQDKVLSPEQFEEAQYAIQNNQPARVLIEKDVVTKNGLQLFQVDKVDHLIPPNVYDDKDVRFRGRRMYLTRGDLELLASDGVRWYDKEKVQKVLDKRQGQITARHLSRTATGDEAKLAQSREDLNTQLDVQDLCYDWRSDDERLSVLPSETPYTSTWAVYRVTCKYGYQTKEDPDGIIPKWCVFDYEPESNTILRSCVYPHFHEKPNWFHFKLGYAPKSYYGFGFGQRLYGDDLLETNAIGLYIEGVALATIKPFKCVSPEFDGLIPFQDGYGPGKIGYVRNMNDFASMDMEPPPEAMLRNLLPLVQLRAENRTGVTSLVQGRTESTDPRSSGTKTQMLLNQAYVSLDSIIEDWALTGWEPLAMFVWQAEYERAVFENREMIKDKINFPGLLPDLEKDHSITLQELKLAVNWKSQASSDYINAEVRETQFLRHFQFFQPMLMQMAKINPQLFQKYFIRWMRWAAQELNIRGLKYLLPTEQEFSQMPPEAAMGMMDNMLRGLKGGQGAAGSPQNMPAPGGEQ